MPPLNSHGAQGGCCLMSPMMCACWLKGSRDPEHILYSYIDRPRTYSHCLLHSKTAVEGSSKLGYHH
eukprot:5753766-Karenia_brevis.AAC.1